ncbi:Hsp20/alpha crystallin family protein [Natrialbaceae archaeon A-CW3]
MSDENTDEQDEPKSSESGIENQSRGFRLEAGLRPLSNLLGNLVEVRASESPPPPENTVDWTAVEEMDTDQQQRDKPSERKRTKRVQKAELEGYLIDTRFDDDEFLVTADIPGASKDDLSVGINPTTNQLVISKEGTVIDRVDLPWESSETTVVWFNNGVLEVRLRSSEDRPT